MFFWGTQAAQITQISRIFRIFYLMFRRDAGIRRLYITITVPRVPFPGAVGLVRWPCARHRSDMRGGLAEVPAAECRRTAGSRHSAAGGQAEGFGRWQAAGAGRKQGRAHTSEEADPRPCALAWGRDAP